MAFVTSLVSIILINLVLSGDNAVVIAAATIKLPESHRQKAIMYGSLVAVGLQILFTFLITFLFRVPLLQAFGGVALVYIAYHLIKEKNDDEEVAASESLWKSIRTIIAANLIMSLDNILAIAGAAHGNYALIAMGLFLGGLILLAGSTLVSMLMERFPALVYAGAGILVWTAGQMVEDDHFLMTHAPYIHHLGNIVPAVMLALSVAFFVYDRFIAKGDSDAAAE